MDNNIKIMIGAVFIASGIGLAWMSAYKSQPAIVLLPIGIILAAFGGRLLGQGTSGKSNKDNK